MNNIYDVVLDFAEASQPATTIFLQRICRELAGINPIACRDCVRELVKGGHLRREDGRLVASSPIIVGPDPSYRCHIIGSRLADRVLIAAGIGIPEWIGAFRSFELTTQSSLRRICKGKVALLGWDEYVRSVREEILEMEMHGSQWEGLTEGRYRYWNPCQEGEMSMRWVEVQPDGEWLAERHVELSGESIPRWLHHRNGVTIVLENRDEWRKEMYLSARRSLHPIPARFEVDRRILWVDHLPVSAYRIMRMFGCVSHKFISHHENVHYGLQLPQSNARAAIAVLVDLLGIKIQEF